jgi:hypothetical protein
MLRDCYRRSAQQRLLPRLDFRWCLLLCCSHYPEHCHWCPSVCKNIRKNKLLTMFSITWQKYLKEYSNFFFFQFWFYFAIAEKGKFGVNTL